MTEKITTANLKQAILAAFHDVVKGQSRGIRECAALDDRESKEEDIAKTAAQDIEKHWWDYPDELKEFSFSFALSYNNKDGIKFHLPALMTAIVEGRTDSCSGADSSVYMTLCVRIPDKRTPHWYSRSYVEHLKSFRVSDVWRYFEFTPSQCQAIALYLLWQMRNEQHHFFENRNDWIAKVKLGHESWVNSEASAENKNYALTLDDAITVVDEKHRIVRDWLIAGDIDMRTFIYDENLIDK